MNINVNELAENYKMYAINNIIIMTILITICHDPYFGRHITV